ncbi:MAG: recombinase family protein [Deltaproteobacteria bacterium]|nr:recombinase family protein [Deltaproteobacteria bacterium]
MKAVILARVSSHEQEQGHSIKAQVDRLQEYCKRKGLEVIKAFQIVESSTRGNRVEFNQMIEFIQSQGETVALVADAVDRVQRGFKESILLEELRRAEVVELHFLRESMVLNKDASSSSLMMWDFSVMGARSYVLQLSENVRRSINFKIKNKQWIAKAPLGYLNQTDPITGKKTLIIDKERAFIIRKLFEDYATGTYSLTELTRRAKILGFTNKSQSEKPVSKSQIHHILRNPFYYGVMRIKDELHEHHYETIIDKALFKKCQEVMESWHKKPFKYASKPFLFRGLLHCGYCGCAVSSDMKKGKYIYLRCTKSKGPCKAVMVREEVIIEQVGEVFKQIHIPENLLSAIEGHLKNSAQAKADYHREAIQKIQHDYNNTKERQNRLLDLFLDKSITKDEYDKKALELGQRIQELEDQLTLHNNADEAFNNTVITLLNLASRAYELFESSKVDQKRQLMNFVLSNLNLKGKNLEFSIRKPFDVFTKGLTRREMLGD